MKFDQYSIFFAIALITSGLSLYLGFAARRLRGKKGTAFFTAMLVLVAVWTSAVAFGMLSADEETAQLWIIIRMIGVIFSPVAWLFLALQYTNRTEQITTTNMVVANIIPAISLILLITNSSHLLFYTKIDFTRAGIFLIDKNWHLGIYFFVHLLYSYILILIGDYLILKEAIRMSQNFRVQSVTLLLATIIPLAVNVSYTFHLIPALKVNYDPLGSVFSMLLFGWGIYFYQLFDLSPIARELLVDNMVDGMIVINQKNQIVDLNPAAKNIFRLDESTIGQNLATVMARNSLPHLNAFGRNDHQEIELDSSNDKTVIYDVQFSSISNQTRVMGKLMTVRNITEQKRIEAKFQQIAITDALTGLTNHRHFYKLLDMEHERSMRNKLHFSVVMMDIDHFKLVNDTYGHLVGDQVLREIATIGKNRIRPYDIFCRYGGEEFSLILPKTPSDVSSEIVDRFRQDIAATVFKVDDISLHLTISMGVSHFDPGNPIEPKVLVGRADQMLYSSKQEGRNRVTCWEQHLEIKCNFLPIFRLSY